MRASASRFPDSPAVVDGAAMLGDGPCTLSVLGAVAWSVIMGSLYVGSLYMVPEHLRSRHRDDSQHIRARFVAVSVASLLSAVLFAFATGGGRCFGDGGTLDALGVKAERFWSASLRALLLTAALYLGPLSVMGLGFFVAVDANCDGVVRTTGDWCDGAAKVLDELMEERRAHYAIPGAVEMSLRNLLVGPLSEEFVFRACMVPLLLEAGCSTRTSVVCSPLFFGVAHLHHLRRRVREDRAPFVEALGQTLFQFAYTTLFGVYTAFVFARTAHLGAAFACHAFCNYMGLPDLDFACVPSDLPWLSKRERLVQVVLHKRRAALFALHGAGIVLFGLLLFPLTTPTTFKSPYWPPRP